MKKTAAERYGEIDFTHATRGPVVPAEPGKTKISICLDNRVLEYFRSLVEQAGGGNYQTLINHALLAYIQRQSLLETVREEFQSVVEQAGLTRHQTVSKPSADGLTLFPATARLPWNSVCEIDRPM